MASGDRAAAGWFLSRAVSVTALLSFHLTASSKVQCKCKLTGFSNKFRLNDPGNGIEIVKIQSNERTTQQSRYDCNSLFGVDPFDSLVRWPFSFVFNYVCSTE